MGALIFLIPLAIALGGTFAVIFLVAARNGQFDDMDDDARRLLEDD